MTRRIKNMTTGNKARRAMLEPTIAAGIVRGLMEFAESKGAKHEDLARLSGIDPAEVRDQDNRIPFERYIALMGAAKELCNDPALALHFGEAIDLGDLSVVGLLGGTCETVADGFALTNQYARLVVEANGVGTKDRFVLTRRAGQVWVVDTRKDPNDFPELTESTFARMVCASRRYSGGTQAVKAVHVTHAEPEYRAEYDRIFRVPVVFGSDKNALLIDESWLTRRVKFSSRYVSSILKDHADSLLETLDSSKSTRGRVERLLLPILHTGDVRVASVARKLGLSRQTLFRRLKAEGVTFEKVLDELRHKTALHCLSEKKVSVNETAYLVGFSDPAAFSRAFKRWTGSSPRKMRRKD